MKWQSKSWWCGVAAIANALEVLGIRRSQREIARSCAVTEEDGTDETEMKRALLANGVLVDEYSGTWGKDSCAWLDDHVAERGPVILCVDNDEHWVTVIGVCRTSFVVFDPARNQGVEIHSWASLCRRWLNSDGVYYGLACSEP